MHRMLRGFVTIASLTQLVACDRGTLLSEAVTITSAPTRLSFSAPVTPRDSAHAVCLSFSPPDGSRRAGDVRVVLVTAQGVRDTLRPRLDRTGESTVCLRDTNAVATARSYASLEFTTPTTLQVARIYWVVAR